MSIYEQLKKAGFVLDNHESDLYVKVTPESQKIVNDYEFKSNVTKFHSQIEGEGMYFDIPFAFDPFWDKKLNKANN